MLPGRRNKWVSPDYKSGKDRLQAQSRAGASDAGSSSVFAIALPAPPPVFTSYCVVELIDKLQFSGYFIRLLGLTVTPFLYTVKCRCGPVLRPVEPMSPMRSPVVT